MDENNQPTTQTKHQPRIKQWISKIRIILIIIVVAIVIFVAIMAIFYMFDNEDPGPTPHGSLSLQDTDTPGKYRLQFGGSVINRDIKLTLYDASLNISVTKKEPKHLDVIQVPGGLNLTYYDNNVDKHLDGSDTLIIHGGGPGDRVIMAYMPNDETFCSRTITE